MSEQNYNELFPDEKIIKALDYKDVENEHFYLLLRYNSTIRSKYEHITVSHNEIIQTKTHLHGKSDYFHLSTLDRVLDNISSYVYDGIVTVRIMPGTFILQTKSYILTGEIQICCIENTIGKTLFLDANFSNQIVRNNLNMVWYAHIFTDEIIKYIILRGDSRQKLLLLQKSDLKDRVNKIKAQYKL